MRKHKTKFKITIPTFVFFAIILFSCRAFYPLLPFAAALLHEAGHLIAMRLCGLRPECITVYPFGIDIKCDSSLLPYKKELFVCSAGISANLLCVLILTVIPNSKANTYAVLFGISNILLIFLNILPIKMLDGGRIAENLLLLFTDPTNASKILNILSFSSMFLLWSLAIYLFFYSSYNFSLFLMCIYLFFSCVFGGRNQRNV